MGTVTALKASPTAAPFEAYQPGGFYCELLGAPDNLNQNLAALWSHLQQLEIGDLVARSKDAERELFTLGITFTVYSDRNAIDRILPFDVLPRVLTAADWRVIDGGVKQRVRALNLFLWDVYHDQHILKDGTLPAELILRNANFRPEMMGYDPPRGAYVHIAGTDIIRDGAGVFYVLEDNARTPSGVSYVVENRHLMQRAFPDLMRGFAIESVSEYGSQLAAKLSEVAPAGVLDPQVVLLSPGVFNSAYFEHVFLAREIGIPLVEGRDLTVENDRVFMKTVSGPKPVHVIYRRLNDDFLDPEIFNPESALGVPGLMRAVRKGHVTLANAVGTGVADDKAVYAYLPRIIKYYLDQDPILPNVKTYICREPDDLRYVLDNLDKLVVKPVGESGGYGICVGPKATKAEIDIIREAVKRDPANYIGQPMIDLSVCPTLTDDGVEPRHVDLRPFAVTGEDTWLLPGGLTRVALKKGSIVVNSSQGGGTKDTWVLREDGPLKEEGA
ncbi:MAG: circularly permuted type 2 ATP-grasp protein [Hyphomicrobiales bacterium]|nr:circularly permuted type 2 ATP-grasp protein [Hyphomicrobiales bacterium]